MSADAALLPCPICSHTGVFESVQSLQDRLICVSTKTILCPVCQEEVIGLDKLIVHLFSHVQIQQLNVKENVEKVKNKGACKKQDSANCSSQQKKPKASGSKNKTQASTSTSPVKYVKIYPKLPVVSVNTMPFIDISSQGPVENGIKKSNPMHGSVVKAEAQIIQPNTTCNVCNIQFVDENILKMHKCLIHNIEDSTEQSLTRYQCHICPKNFKMRGSLMVHLRVAHFGFSSDKTVEKDGATLKFKGGNSDEIQDSKCVTLERSDSKQWQCDVCRKSFTTKYFLKKHKRLHTGETPYACTQCNKTFTFQQSYHKHLLYHNDEKPHTCSFCGRAFKELSTLHNHQRIHTGEKPFSCETCGKSFRQRVSYLVHRRIHTGVMPYKCTACNKNFRYKVSQRTHKCPAQPPGTVIRQSGDLLEKLKKKHANDLQTKSVPEPNENIKYPEVSEANAELVRCGAKLSLEDTETEHFTLIEEAFNNNVYSDFIESDVQTLRDMNESNTVIDKNMPSPSEILKNLCLSKEDEDTISNNVHENEAASNYCEYDDLFTSNKILFM